MTSTRPTTAARTAQGLFANLGAPTFVAVLELRGSVPAAIAPWLLEIAIAAGAIVSLGGLALVRMPATGGVLVSLGLATAVAAAWPSLVGAPGTALPLLVLVTGLTYVAWTAPRSVPDPTPHRDDRPGRATAGYRAAARASSWVALATWFLVVLGEVGRGTASLFAVGASFAVSGGFVLVWLRAEPRGLRVRRRWLFVAVLVALATMAAVWGRWPLVLTSIVVVPLTALSLARPGEPVGRAPSGIQDLLFSSSARLLVTTFLAMCLGGWIALALPACAAKGTEVSLVDAAFTSVSAVCVTGLVVLDTPHAFSVVGQVVILLLIQCGGLGIMTFSTAALAAFGRRLSLKHEGSVAALLSRENRGDLLQVLRIVLGVTFVSEAAGAVSLAVLFYGAGDRAGMAAWRGLFTAVSAFCNAGFALQTNSLVPYQEHAAILQVVALLIVLGGLSPLVVVGLPRLLFRGRAGVHAKIVLLSTAVLLVVGAVAFAALEWNASLGHLPVTARLNNAWFQSVTPRTAGFNSIDFAGLRPSTETLMLVLMFIGGSPGGTAGGIKTTTVAVLLLVVVGALRGRWRIMAFGRQIPVTAAYRATAIATVGVLTGWLAILAIELTQNLRPASAVFEVVSALGTVGLSLGATPMLDGVGKIVIMFCMFAGRVGPLSLILFLGSRDTGPAWKLPEEDVDIG